MADLLTDIADLVADLADPRQHTERVTVGWTKSRNPIRRTHVTTQPGLLAQLADAIAGVNYASAEHTGRPRPGGRPPLNLEALSRHAAIIIGITHWTATLDLNRRPTPEDNLRALGGAAPQLDHNDQATLLAELRRWRRWCAVLTGWESKAYAPRVPCPVCAQPGTLRINLAAKTAYCGHEPCGAGWDPATIGVLGDYIRTTTDEAAA